MQLPLCTSVLQVAWNFINLWAKATELLCCIPIVLLTKWQHGICQAKNSHSGASLQFIQPVDSTQVWVDGWRGGNQVLPPSLPLCWVAVCALHGCVVPFVLTAAECVPLYETGWLLKGPLGWKFTPHTLWDLQKQSTPHRTHKAKGTTQLNDNFWCKDRRYESYHSSPAYFW